MPRSILHLLDLIPAWVCTTLCLAAILWLTLAPSPTPEVDLPLFPGADKVVHAAMFGGLTLIACYDYIKYRGKRHHTSIGMPWVMGAASTATGVIIEFLQQAMNLGRAFETADMIADACGAAIAAALVVMYLRLSRTRHRE